MKTSFAEKGPNFIKLGPDKACKIKNRNVERNQRKKRNGQGHDRLFWPLSSQ